MTASFLHGAETIEVEFGGKTIRVVKNSVIGIVGIAPKGPINDMKVIATESGGIETFGKQLPGFNIPQALSAAFANDASRVIVVNVFDPATMTTPVVAENLTIVTGKAALAKSPVDTPVLTNSGATVTFTEGTDYSIDEFGNIVVLNFTTIPEGATVLATYKHLNEAAVTDALIIGTSTGGVRTGFKKFEEARSQFGYGPKILISPYYCENSAVAAEMIVQADKLRAITFIDAPAGTIPADAIVARGPSGTLAGFMTSNKRTVLCTPYLKAYNPATNSDQDRPASQFFAGVMSGNPNYWESLSNTEIKGITGVERTITAAINDPDTEANQLNEAGIVTIFSDFGSGTRVWGNRSASFPTNTSIDNFISIQRTKDILHESLELGMLPFIDKAINPALIDSIRQSCQQFINTLISRGALLVGSTCTFVAADNPATEIAAGHLTFQITWVAPPPAERITFKSQLDVNLLNNLI